MALKVFKTCRADPLRCNGFQQFSAFPLPPGFKSCDKPSSIVLRDMPQICAVDLLLEIPALGIAADFVADFGNQADRLLLLMGRTWV